MSVSCDKFKKVCGLCRHFHKIRGCDKYICMATPMVLYVSHDTCFNECKKFDINKRYANMIVCNRCRKDKRIGRIVTQCPCQGFINTNGRDSANKKTKNFQGVGVCYISVAYAEKMEGG